MQTLERAEDSRDNGGYRLGGKIAHDKFLEYIEVRMVHFKLKRIYIEQTCFDRELG